MLRPDLILNKGRQRIYGAGRFDVTVGDEFRIVLVDAEFKVQWFSNNDQVLDIKEDPSGSAASVTAAGVGHSIIELKRGNQVVGAIRITVKPAPAAQLHPTIGQPVQQ